MMMHLRWKFGFQWSALVLVLFCLPCVASATLITSFETGDLDGWTAGTPFGSATVVNSNRASIGVYSTESVFTVPASFGAGWSMNTLISRGTADIGITSSTTEISLDAYTDLNLAGWGVYGNAIMLTLNYEGFWGQISPNSGSMVNGAFSTLTFDISGHAAAMTNPALSYSAVEVVWHLGAWAGGPDAVQTISIDNINGNNLAVIPEPTSLFLLACSAAALFGTRRPRTQ